MSRRSNGARSGSAAAALESALHHHRAGRLADAAAGYRRVLVANPRQPDALHLLGVLAHQAGDHARAAELIGRAIAAAPGVADFHSNLGNVLWTQGRAAEAEASCRRAIALAPGHHEAHYNLGNARWAQGRLDEAVESYRRAVVLSPGHVEALSNLGAVLKAQGRLDEAIACCERAIALRENHAEARNNLGSALLAAHRPDEAVVHLRRALALDPRVPETHVNLCNALIVQQKNDEAIAACHAALALRPDYAKAHGALGNALTAEGRLDEAIACYRRALALLPAYPEAHSNLIFALDFDARATSAAAFEERRRWNTMHAYPHTARVVPHTNDRTPDRRLRVGYVSADFCRHSASTVFGPVLLAHDHERVHVTGYSGVRRPDVRTARLQAAADAWRPIADLDDDAVAALVREDQIDILVDLSGHTSGHRLLVFARKPAPVQVTAWGHALGTGLDAIDYFFADPVAVPLEARADFAEEVVDLPVLVPYDPLDPSPPVSPAPALGGAPFTFGCFNRLAKITPAALAVWAAVLAAAPGSRLLFKFTGLERPENQRRIRSTLAAHGVAEDRVFFLGGSSAFDHLAAFAHVDVALDPFPHGGGVSALDALWMGVPLVTLCGARVPGRIGASILTALGLEALVADTEARYVEIATALARDLDTVAGLRPGLRQALHDSPICDHRAYTRTVEDAYRAMWYRWCGSRSS